MTGRLRSGAWQPGPAVQAAARALHPTLAAAPDAPTLPAEATAPAWIQRAVRLEHILTTLRTVRDHHKPDPELDTGGWEDRPPCEESALHTGRT